MLRFVLLVSWLALAYGSAIGPSRGIPQSPIVGGEDIVISDAPWQVALEYDYNGIGFFSLRCGGTIIGRTFILTAAHCTFGSTEKEWRVRAGSSSHASGGNTFIVIKIVNHEQYSRTNYDYDISIMKLYEAIQVDDIFTQVINLPRQNQVVEPLSSAVVTGWGSVFSGGEISTTLRRVTLPVVDQGACAELYSGYNTVTDRMICGGVLGEGGKDACQGDSGGPFIILGQLIGITSWGRSCGLGDAPGVWTRVPIFVDWINEQKLSM